jgi:hypothetical protein
MAVSAFADNSFQGEYDFSNPNGCRAYFNVVDPGCSYDAAQDACGAAQTVVAQLAAEAPQLGLKANCDVLHTGNFFQRMLDEMMEGPSFDGYKLDLEVTAPSSNTSTPAIQLTAHAADATTCEDAAQALAKLNQQSLQVTASCDADELRASFQF